MFFEKFPNTSTSMRQVGPVIPFLYPDDLFDQRFKCVAFHRQNDSEQNPKLR